MRSAHKCRNARVAGTIATSLRLAVMNEPMLNCLIIGGGPAGLTAAIYLSRYHFDIRVVDAGRSRALWIPCTHNHAGYPEGIGGADLLDRMREQAVRYGSKITPARVSRLESGDACFEAEWGEGSVLAKTVLLATGVQNRRPSIDEALHDEALAEGFLRYCPVCDGYEVTDQNVAVIGTGERGVAEAAFLRSYTRRVTLIAPDGCHELSEADRRKAAQYGLTMIDGPAHIAAIVDRQIVIESGGKSLAFDTCYPALGSDINNHLALAIGAETDDHGSIKVDDHQRTSIDGLYAAGDVVVGLDQISHAMGEGGVAATTIRNDMSERAPLLR